MTNRRGGGRQYHADKFARSLFGLGVACLIAGVGVTLTPIGPSLGAALGVIGFACLGASVLVSRVV